MKRIRIIILALLILTLVYSNASAENHWNCGKCFNETSDWYTVCSKCKHPMDDIDVFLVISFKSNWFFSKYGVKILIDNVPAFFLDHGQNLTRHLRLANGVHTIRFEKEDDSQMATESDFTVKSDCETKFNIETNRLGINIKDSSCLAVQYSHSISFSRKMGRRGREYLTFYPESKQFNYSSSVTYTNLKHTSSHNSGTYQISGTHIILHYNDPKTYGNETEYFLIGYRELLRCTENWSVIDDDHLYKESD